MFLQTPFLPITTNSGQAYYTIFLLIYQYMFKGIYTSFIFQFNLIKIVSSLKWKRRTGLIKSFISRKNYVNNDIKIKILLTLFLGGIIL